MGLEFGESRKLDPAGFVMIFPLGHSDAQALLWAGLHAVLRHYGRAAKGGGPWESRRLVGLCGAHVFFPMKLAILRQFWAKITEGGRNILQVGAFSWRNFLGCHGMPVPPFSTPTQRKIAEMHRYPLHFSWDFLGLLELETAKEVHHPSEGCASASCGTGSVEFGCDVCWFA